MLAAKVIQQQGIEVDGVNFFTGFCVEGHTRAIRSSGSKPPQRHSALWAAEQIGIKLQIVDIATEYKDVVLNPKYGYGKNLNPCLDCKVFMVAKAIELKSSDGSNYDFVITGEVIGQRPKSQKKETMPIIARDSGAEDRLVRPLCAKLLPPTLPERNGWIDRDQLFDFTGRSRRPQMALAERLGITEYAQPAGGCCFLTDETYSSRLQDLWDTRGRRDYELKDVVLLKVGRHIRPTSEFKVIVGRDQGENNFLRGFRKEFLSLETTSHLGATALFDGSTSDDNVKLAASIVARYSQAKPDEDVVVAITRQNGVSSDLRVCPMLPYEINPAWMVGSSPLN